MNDKKLLKEIAESNKHCAKNLDELIANLKRAKMPQETIQKAVDMRTKYQKIAEAGYQRTLKEHTDHKSLQNLDMFVFEYLSNNQ